MTDSIRPATSEPKHRVIVVGGGFGGVAAVKTLRRADVDVTLIDRRNFHLFQPLLYQVATGALSPANIASPLRAIFRKQRNTRVVMGEVVAIDTEAKRVTLDDKRLFDYDSLLIAAGMTDSYFGNDEWEQSAPGLKTVEQATDIRAKLLSAFEHAELESDATEREALMTFVVVGAGPTGVEMAGAIAEIAKHTLRNDFRWINPSEARIILLEGGQRVLSTFSEKLSSRAMLDLQRLGVDVRLQAKVTNIADDRVQYKDLSDATDQHTTEILTRTVVWAAGVKAASLAAIVATATNIETKHGGRVPVSPNLSVAGFPDVFVIGDMAWFENDEGKPLPGVAPVAIQQGKFFAWNLKKRLEHKSVRSKFVYKDQGNLATIGRKKAVADLGKIKLTGYAAWILWLVIHLMQIVQHQNRVLIFFQWAWSYVTFNRSARLITGKSRNAIRKFLIVDDSDGGTNSAEAVETTSPKQS